MTSYLGTVTFWEEYQAARANPLEWLAYLLEPYDALAQPRQSPYAHRALYHVV